MCERVYDNGLNIPIKRFNRVAEDYYTLIKKSCMGKYKYRVYDIINKYKLNITDKALISKMWYISPNKCFVCDNNIKVEFKSRACLSRYSERKTNEEFIGYKPICSNCSKEKVWYEFKEKIS